MKYIVAVSGGVDSVVLLDMLVREHEHEHELIVAHMDHGIRGEESAADARFVEALAHTYQLPVHTGSGNLDPYASEAEAREKRYAFLFRIAQQHDAVLVTAHHGDDVVETIAINQMRGTGWRGLAVLGSQRVIRPLLGKTKQEIYEYALAHNLEWVEDSTNVTDAYLRNRLRRKLGGLNHGLKQRLRQQRDEQIELADMIDAEVARLLVPSQRTSRYFFTMIEEECALELLRSLTDRALTRPQLRRVLLAIKTYPAGTICEAGSNVRIRFTAKEFIVENTSAVL